MSDCCGPAKSSKTGADVNNNQNNGETAPTLKEKIKNAFNPKAKPAEVKFKQDPCCQDDGQTKSTQSCC